MQDDMKARISVGRSLLGLLDPNSVEARLEQGDLPAPISFLIFSMVFLRAFRDNEVLYLIPDNWLVVRPLPI